MSRHTTAIVMLTWNRLKVFKKAIKTFKKYHPQIEDKHFIVVDNGSTDGTREFLESTKFDLILNESNLGAQMGKYVGWNRAVERGYDFIFFIEDDHTCYGAVPILRIQKYLDKNRDVGIFRVYAKPFKRRHLISWMPVTYRPKEKFVHKFYIQRSDYNFGSHPVIFRTSLVHMLKRCVFPENIKDRWQDFKYFEGVKKPTRDARKRCERSFGRLETEYMRLYMKSYKWSVRMFPPCFSTIKQPRENRPGWRS